MKLAAIDALTLTALMAMGAVCTIAGLWLMFRPKVDGHSARIELLGMKFQSSSAGLLVFLIGAAFFATPLFAPKAVTGGTGGVTNRTVTAIPAEQERLEGTTPRYIFVEATEVEPNDSPAGANAIPLGATINGEFRMGNGDFFAMDLPDGFEGTVSFNATAEEFTMRVYDDLGAEITERSQWGYGSVSYSEEVRFARYYVSVAHWHDRTRFYQLTVAGRPR